MKWGVAPLHYHYLPKTKVKSFCPPPPSVFSTYTIFNIYRSSYILFYIYTKLIRLSLDNIYVNQLIIK